MLHEPGRDHGVDKSPPFGAEPGLFRPVRIRGRQPGIFSQTQDVGGFAVELKEDAGRFNALGRAELLFGHQTSVRPRSPFFRASR